MPVIKKINQMLAKTITCALLFILSPLSFGEDSRFYDITSFLSIQFALHAYDLESDQSRKLQIAKEISRTMFTYWYESRHLGLRKTRVMDSVIVTAYAAYKEGTMKGDFLKDVFQDPLDWISGNNNIEKLEKRHKHWKIGNIDEYKKLLADYLAYLEKRVAELEPIE